VRWVALACLCVCAACGGDPDAPGVSSRFAPDAGFFDAPFPIAHRGRDDGSLRVMDFPNPNDNAFLGQLLTLLEEGRAGFSLNGAILVPFDGAIAIGRLPMTPEEALDPDGPIHLVNITPGSARYGERVPFEAAFKREAETYSPADLLVVVPYQGVVLERNAQYALIVRRGLGDAEGRPLFQPETLSVLLAGDVPAGASGAALALAFAPLRDWLADEGIATGDVAAATVFQTGDPLAEMAAWQEQISALAAPALSDATHVADYDGYCVVSARTSLPVYQRGPKPYADFGSGQMVTDGAELVEQARDDIEIFLTIPHAAMPADGFPLVLYAAGAEGKARQVIDRTRIDADPDEGLGPPGEGPAKHYAARGWGALGFPAPLNWDRHPDGDGGLLDFWNVANLGAFRDNIRQGIVDFSSLVPLATSLVLDASVCPLASSPSGTFHYDPAELLLHGHSTGSTIGSAAIALEPRLRAAVLSGAGGSWMYKMVLAEAPLKLATVAAILLDFDHPDVVDLFDPTTTLFQTALEPIEVMDWGVATIIDPLPNRDPRQILLIEGVVDSYHFPRMVNAYAMSVGLDLIEPQAEPTAADDYALVGRGVIAAPAVGNVDHPSGDVTAVTIQRAQNEHDGHYVSFEHDDVKYRYGCFADTLRRDGVAKVPLPNDDAFAPCP
jgi:hypothetical protein